MGCHHTLAAIIEEYFRHSFAALTDAKNQLSQKPHMQRWSSRTLWRAGRWPIFNSNMLLVSPHAAQHYHTHIPLDIDGILQQLWKQQLLTNTLLLDGDTFYWEDKKGLQNISPEHQLTFSPVLPYCPLKGRSIFPSDVDLTTDPETATRTDKKQPPSRCTSIWPWANPCW